MTIITNAGRITDKQIYALYSEACEAVKKLDFKGLYPIAKNPSSSLLVLDFDGTNSVFVTNPNDVVWYSGLKKRVVKLHETGYNVAISSGRGLDDLQRVIGIPQIKNYAGIHGNQILLNGDRFRNYLPKERQIQLRQIYDGILNSLNENHLPIEIEYKPGSMVLHWREYCEKECMSANELSGFEKELFDEVIDPVLDKYNTQADSNLRIKATNHGMNADFSAENARNKGHALLDFAFLDCTPLYKNILVLGDSASDETMIRMADELSGRYNIYVVSITVQQKSTPDWMMKREYPHIVLPYCKQTDPDNKVGGVPLVGFVYDRLLGL